MAATLARRPKKVRPPGWNKRNKPDGPLSVEERNRVLTEWLAEHPRPVKLMTMKWPKVVKSLRRDSYPLTDDEVNQICLTGAVEAGRLFDPALGVKFSTFAEWHMLHAMTKSLRVRAKGRLGRSLDVPVSGRDDTPQAEVVPDHRPVAELDDSDSIRRIVDAAIATALPDPRQRQVMRWRFGLNGGDRLTLQEIADRLGVSRERVRQIEVQCLKRLNPTISELAGRFVPTNKTAR